MAYPDKFGLAFEPTKTELELADLKLDWLIALMRGAERDVLRIRAELEAQGLRYNEEIGKWEETDVFASRYDHEVTSSQTIPRHRNEKPGQSRGR